MPDDASAKVERLEAELRELRELRAADRAEADGLRVALAAAEGRGAAMAELLQVVATSRVDLQRVLAAVAERALRLCDAASALIWRTEGDVMRCVARAHPGASSDDRSLLGQTLPLSPRTMTGRAVLDAQVLHLHDVRTAETQAAYP